MPLTDLGIDPDTDLADQYDFTRTTASDSDGVQRGSTWQCCPGTLVYRRDIAKEVFGTDDPAEVGEKVKDWDTMTTHFLLMQIPSVYMETASHSPGYSLVRQPLQLTRRLWIG